MVVNRTTTLRDHTPSLDLMSLAGSGKFKTSVLKELENETGNVPLKPLIREYIEQLGIVHTEFRAATELLVAEATCTVPGCGVTDRV